MNNPIYFITPNFLRSHGYINKNVDELLYSNLIEPTAKSFIRKQIGTYFFNSLLTKYNAQTLTADEEIVVEYIQFSTANRVKAELVIEASWQLTNKGLQQQSSDNSDAVDIKTVGIRSDGLLQRAIQYELELAEYLTDNKDLYPDFLSVLNKDSSIKNKCCKGGDFYAEGQSVTII